MEPGLCTTITITGTKQDETLLVSAYRKIAELVSVQRRGTSVNGDRVSVFVTLINDESLGVNFFNLSNIYRDLVSKCKGTTNYIVTF